MPRALVAADEDAGERRRDAPDLHVGSVKPDHVIEPDDSAGELMSELKATDTSSTVDEGARFRAFTALALALAALMGGGVFSTGLQWLANYRFVNSPDDPSYALALASAPLVMSVMALWLASSAASSTDSIARPLARSAHVLSIAAILGAALVAVAVLSQP